MIALSVRSLAPNRYTKGTIYHYFIVLHQLHRGVSHCTWRCFHRMLLPCSNDHTGEVFEMSSAGGLEVSPVCQFGLSKFSSAMLFGISCPLYVVAILFSSSRVPTISMRFPLLQCCLLADWTSRL